MRNRNRLLAIILAGCLAAGMFVDVDRQSKEIEKIQVQETVADLNIDVTNAEMVANVEEEKSKLDPAKDSDKNGILDGAEDFDSDGILNEEELNLGTNPEKKDSDKDGVTDIQEIENYGTDPTVYDADGDGLSDGDEILLGLDPHNEMSDGETPDSERTFVQQLGKEKISEKLLADHNKAIPSLTVTISGNVNKKVSVSETSNVDFEENSAIVGEPVDVCGAEITEGTISFSLGEEAVNAETKIICSYDEQGNTRFLDTVYKEEDGSLQAEISGEGTYFVMDAEALFHQLGITFPVTMADAVETERSERAVIPADIVFVIDTTGSMREEINNVKENVGMFVENLRTKGISVDIALVTYQDLAYDGEDTTVVHKNGAENWFTNVSDYQEVLAKLPLGRGGDLPESALDALETARLLDMRASAGKIFVLVTDAPYHTENRYAIPSMEAEIELLNNLEVQCSVVSNIADKGTYEELYGETGGMWMDIEGDFHQHLTTLAEQIGEELTGDGYWIYLQGPVPVPVRLDAKPTAGSMTDTDKDGITDVEELGSAEPTGSIDLDALLETVSKGAITGTNYGMVQTYVYTSNPGETDTDFDGVDDSYDPSPRDNHGSGVMRYSIDGSSYNLNIEFNMDYRNLIAEENNVYTKDISMLSVLYATDVYDTAYIEVNNFSRTGGSETGTNFGDLMGLQDTRYVAVNSVDYAEDKDDITDFFIGHKKLVYNGEAHEVIVVSVRGTDGTNEEWSSNFDIGADTSEYYATTGTSHPYWKNKQHHKGFDVAANRALEKINVYINQYVNPYAKKSILITGHSRGAAIANILGKYFEEQQDYRAYTYTFATPRTTTASNAASYLTIFNVDNTDDIISYMPLDSWGFTKYGKTTAICVEDYYENELGAAEEGSWEWFMGGTDYDNDYNTQSTLNAIAKIASNREGFYKLGTTDSEKVWEDDLGHTTQAGAQEELAELTRVLEEEKLLKFCNMYIVKNWFIYHVEINYCPAYLLQTLANMTTGVGPLLGRDVAGVYADAKTAFVASSGKVVIGGMTHPHMPPTYYIMTYHDLKSLY